MKYFFPKQQVSIEAESLHEAELKLTDLLTSTTTENDNSEEGKKDTKKPRK